MLAPITTACSPIRFMGDAPALGLPALRRVPLVRDLKRAGFAGRRTYRSQICQERFETGPPLFRAGRPTRIDRAATSGRIGDIMEATFQIFLILLAVLAGTALFAK